MHTHAHTHTHTHTDANLTHVHKIDITGGLAGGMIWAEFVKRGGRGRERRQQDCVGIKVGTVWTVCPSLIHLFNHSSFNSTVHPATLPHSP